MRKLHDIKVFKQMMSIKKLFRFLVLSGLLFCNVACDQVSKNVARTHLASGDRIEILGPYFTLSKTENTGAFLSLGQQLPAPWKNILLILFPVLALLAALLWLFSRNKLSRAAMIGLACVIGGGAGNLYDRLLYGSVTDFIHMDFVIFETGIFNMADVSIMLGAGLLLQAYWPSKKEASGLAG